MGAKLDYQITDNTACYTTLRNVKHSSSKRPGNGHNRFKISVPHTLQLFWLTKIFLYLWGRLFPVVPDFGQTSGFRFYETARNKVIYFFFFHFWKKTALSNSGKNFQKMILSVTIDLGGGWCAISVGNTMQFLWGRSHDVCVAILIQIIQYYLEL